MRMLKLLHCFDLTLDFLLHAELSDLVLVEDFECDGFTYGFVFSHYAQDRMLDNLF